MTRARDAFETCWQVYRQAKLIREERIPTLSLELIPGPRGTVRRVRGRLGDFVADFARCGRRALASKRLASRLQLFELYHLGGARYQAARRVLGVSELTWADWVDEIRERVGKRLIHEGLYPPKEYFS